MKTPSVAEVLAERAGALRAENIPAAVRTVCENLLIDVAGLCVAARNTEYALSLKKSLDAGGACTALGHAESYRPEDAALLNGTAAHGEDFDDTFEGGPVHSGAVVVPAVLAACERFGCGGPAALLGIATGVETLCRLSLVAPKLVHKAGFHPTSVLGAMAATVGVSAALGLDRKQIGRCARHRRQHGGRHHRIPRRGRVDQAAARGLGGARRPARGAHRARGVSRTAHGVRGHARPVLRLSPARLQADFDVLTA